MSERPFISNALGSRPTVPYPNAATVYIDPKLAGWSLSSVPGQVNVSQQLVDKPWPTVGRFTLDYYYYYYYYYLNKLFYCLCS